MTSETSSLPVAASDALIVIGNIVRNAVQFNHLGFVDFLATGHNVAVHIWIYHHFPFLFNTGPVFNLLWTIIVYCSTHHVYA